MMRFNTLDDFFLKATGEHRFPYQAEFANAKELFELLHCLWVLDEIQLMGVGLATSFFPAALARYAYAKRGVLRIVRPNARLPELEQDYRKMQQMSFGELPAFERLL